MKRFVKPALFAALLIGLAIAGYYIFAKWFRERPLPKGLIQASGRIEGDRISIASKYGGRIETLQAHEGEHVEAGQVLARLEGKETQANLEQAESRVRQLKQQVRQAQQDDA